MADRQSAPDFAGRLVEPGLWVEATGRADWPRGRPALFLDRDGTIIIDTDFPSHPDEVVLREEMLPVIRAANRAATPVVVVSNQSGIARGYFGWPEFATVNNRVLDLLRARSCSVDLVIACAYYPSGQGPLAIADHPMRKPNPGMLLLARDRLGLDFARSILVGDKLSDMEAARRAGLAAGWLIGHDPAESEGLPVQALGTAAEHAALVQAIADLAT